MVGTTRGAQSSPREREGNGEWRLMAVVASRSFCRSLPSNLIETAKVNPSTPPPHVLSVGSLSEQKDAGS